MIRLAIVDDHQIVVDGIVALLKNNKDFKIVHTANSANEVLQLLKTEAVDILLTDIIMPEISGYELAKEVHQLYPSMGVIALSMNSDGNTVDKMINSGYVDGYLLKHSGIYEIVEAVKAVYAGKQYFQQPVLQSLQEENSLKKEVININLSNREIEIIELLSKDFNNKEIAEKLFISTRTVETHRKNIFRKTGTNNIMSLLKWAKTYRIID